MKHKNLIHMMLAGIQATTKINIARFALIIQSAADMRIEINA